MHVQYTRTEETLRKQETGKEQRGKQKLLLLTLGRPKRMWLGVINRSRDNYQGSFYDPGKANLIGKGAIC